MSKLYPSISSPDPGRPSLKNRLSKSLKAPRAKSRVQKYNEGELDDFGILVQDRLTYLEISRSQFADNCDATIVRSDISGPHMATQTSKSLITRVIDGNRGIPLPRILSWARALKIRGEQRKHQFLMIAITANALRDARRLVSKRNSERVALVQMLKWELIRQVSSFQWGDGCDGFTSKLRQVEPKFQ